MLTQWPSAGSLKLAWLSWYMYILNKGEHENVFWSFYEWPSTQVRSPSDPERGVRLYGDSTRDHPNGPCIRRYNEIVVESPQHCLVDSAHAAGRQSFRPSSTLLSSPFKSFTHFLLRQECAATTEQGSCIDSKTTTTTMCVRPRVYGMLLTLCT